MDTTLFATIAGLAAVDALNPFTIAALAYLLATPKSMPRSAMFIAGTFLTYFMGGVALVRGFGYITSVLLPRLPMWVIPSGEVVLGVACLVLSVVTFRRSKTGKPAFSPPKDLSIFATALFAIGSTASDIPTGAPYIAAAGKISAGVDSWVLQLLWLGFYNLLYVAPLLILFFGHILLGRRAEGLFGRIQKGIDWAFAHLTPVLLLALGGWLLYDAYGRMGAAG